MSQFLVTLPVLIAAGYSLFVSLCVTARMDRRSNHLIRIAIISAAGLSCWALLRSLSGGWDMDLSSLTHGALVIAGAFIIARFPRIPT